MPARQWDHKGAMHPTGGKLESLQKRCKQAQNPRGNPPFAVKKAKTRTGGVPPILTKMCEGSASIRCPHVTLKSSAARAQSGSISPSARISWNCFCQAAKVPVAIASRMPAMMSWK